MKEAKGKSREKPDHEASDRGAYEVVVVAAHEEGHEGKEHEQALKGEGRHWFVLSVRCHNRIRRTLATRNRGTFSQVRADFA